MTWPILSALAGALLLAFGAALQERAVSTLDTPGRTSARPLLRTLVRRPGWLLGAAASAAGVGLHLLALSAAPLSLVQPLGVSGLLFAVAAAAVLARRRITGPELGGALLVTAGLAALVLAVPHHADRVPGLGTAAAAALCATGAGTVLFGLAVAGHLAAPARAVLLACAAGVSFGAVSAFARVVGAAAVRDPGALLHWHTGAAVALAALGGVAVQHAYRAGRFALAFAVLLLADPVAAAAIGVLFLGERPPSGAAALLASAVLVLPGVVLLARARRPVASATA